MFVRDCCIIFFEVIWRLLSMKKKAFTLAEVLITIGLIGIVAALTMPTLMKMNQEAGIGPMLAKAQYSVEEAVGRMQLDDIDTSLSDINVADLMGKLENYLLISDGRLKDGIYIEFSTFDGTVPTIPSAAGGVYAKVKVDTNGTDVDPNAEGVDQFYFVLSKSGMMVPIDCTKEIANNNWKVPKDYDSESCKSSAN